MDLSIKKTSLLWDGLNRKPIRIRRIAAALFLLMGILITLALYFILLDSAKNEFISNQNFLKKTSVELSEKLKGKDFEIIGDKLKTIKSPLKTINAISSPSPFKFSGINGYINSQEFRTYYSKKEFMKALVIKSSIKLNVKEDVKEKEFLSFIVFFNDSRILVDQPLKFLHRNSGDHFVVSYASKRKGIKHILITPQPNFNKIKQITKTSSEPFKIAEISGFLIDSLDTSGSTGLIRDTSIKGSLFSLNEKTEYALIFRVAIDNNKRGTQIDTNTPLGLTFNNRDFYNNTASNKISTFHINKDTSKNIPLLNPITTPLKKLIDPRISSAVIKAEDTQVSHSLKTPTSDEKSIYSYLSSFLELLFFSHLFTLGPEESYKTSVESNSLGFKYYLVLKINHEIIVTNWIDKNSNYFIIFPVILIILFAAFFLLNKFVIRRVLELSNVINRYDDRDREYFLKHLKSKSDEISSVALTIHKALYRLDLKKKKQLKIEAHLKQQLAFRKKIISLLSHEINSPLQSLNALLNKMSYESLAQREFQSSTESFSFFLKRIERASKNILSATKLEDSFSKKEIKTSINLSEISNNIVKAKKDSLDGKSKSIEFIESPDVYAIADDGLLEDIIDNILDNAFDYSDKVEIGTLSNEKCKSIYLRNNGEQIDRRNLNEIFEYGVSSRISTQNHHFGIGLFSCRLRMNIMNGDINAENLKKGGVQFNLIFYK